MTDELPTLDPTPDPSEGSSSGGGADSGGFIPPADSPARMPKQIGKFRIKKLIATGGMGAVYQGVQEQPRRTVAIKLMKSGVTSKSALRRFEYESQLLARLRHPGIAEVYDAGTHEAHDGAVPYFVMEYIPGAKRITQYAIDKKLSTTERLKLFIEVAAAVHHGHTKGIIHRDLKPDNILVDSHGRVKIIDFGVARATDSDLAVTTLQTDIGQLIGTVQYMSPEQVEADPEDLDTRSDVYALGVVLYEMLCDQLPYDVSKMKIFDATRVVREQEALKLSTINTALRGDIETITLKALEKDRDRRYQSAENLAADITRYLNNEPIMAHPPSVAYQMRIFARRNKAMMTGVGAVFAALLLGVIASTALWLDASAARDYAENEAAKAKQAVAILTEMVGAANPAANKGSDYTILQMLDDFAAELSERLAGQPEVEADIRTAIGQAYWELRLSDKAHAEFTRALELRKQVFGQTHAKVATSLVDLGRVALQFNRHEEMAMLASKAFAIHEQLGAPTLEMAEAMRWMGNAHRMQGGFELGVKRLRHAIQIARQASGDAESQVLADAMHDLSAALLGLGQLDEAVSVARQAADMHHRTHGDHHPETAYGYFYLSQALTARGDFSEALQASQNVFDIRKVILSPDHNNMVASYSLLIGRYAAVGRWDDALAMAQNGVEQTGATFVYTDLAYLYMRLGDGASLNKLYADWLTTRDPNRFIGLDRLMAIPYLLGAPPVNASEPDERFITAASEFTEGDASWIIFCRGIAAYRLGDWTGAITSLDEALQDQDAIWRPTALAFKAMALHQLGDREQTRPLLDQAQTLYEATELDFLKKNDWRSMVSAQIVLKEAQTLIHP